MVEEASGGRWFGVVAPGDTIEISFAAKGSFAVGGVAFAEFFSVRDTTGAQDYGAWFPQVTARYRVTDFLDDRAMTLVVDGRIRLLNDAGICVRKLNAGNAYAVGDYYLHDEEMYRTLHVVKASPKITVLNLKYSDLANLEQSQPHVAIHLHKLMARSLAQKNRNSKLAHRVDA